MAEIVTLSTPITRPSTTSLRLQRFSIDFDVSTVFVQWSGDDGNTFSATYPTPAPAGTSQPTGAALINALNTANMSTNSFVKRVYQRLQADGYISAGSVNGTPS